MKLIYMEINATAEEIKANQNIGDALRNALIKFGTAMETFPECDEEEENED